MLFIHVLGPDRGKVRATCHSHAISLEHFPECGVESQFNHTLSSASRRVSQRDAVARLSTPRLGSSTCRPCRSRSGLLKRCVSCRCQPCGHIFIIHAFDFPSPRNLHAWERGHLSGCHSRKSIWTPEETSYLMLGGNLTSSPDLVEPWTVSTRLGSLPRGT
jgi:hypothetical protein